MSVYMDNASTTSLSAEAYSAFIDSLANLNGNPSAVHSSGFAAFSALERARSQIAELIGCTADNIIFTSGGSESNNLAIFSLAELGRRQGRLHAVTTAIEHHSVLEALKHLEGFEITYVKPSNSGIVSAYDILSSVRDDTAFVSVMTANNEVGTLQPIGEIASACQGRSIPFHTDAVQAVGHIHVDVTAVGADMMSFAAHKFHGPKGVGALFVRDPNMMTPIIRGGLQEYSIRAGTENLPAIVAMAAALKEALSERDAKNRRVLAMRERLIDGILKIEGAYLNGDREMRLPGNANFCFGGVGGEQLVILLDSYGVEASSGSACSARSPDPSHVLTAMGIERNLASSSLRLSIDEYNTDSEIDEAVETVIFAVNKIRNI